MDEHEHGDRLYALGEVRRRLSIGRSKAYELVATRRLPAVKVGRALRVRGKDLERFIEENRY